MKAYRITLLVVDHAELGGEDIRSVLEDLNIYPNDCISPHVLKTEEADIGEWHDGHPMNYLDKMKAEAARLFDGDAHDLSRVRMSIGDVDVDVAPGTEDIEFPCVGSRAAHRTGGAVFDVVARPDGLTDETPGALVWLRHGEGVTFVTPAQYADLFVTLIEWQAG